MTETERLARLEERMGRTEADVSDLRRNSVTREVFEARMATVDLKLDDVVDVLSEVKTELIKRRDSWRNGLVLPLLASLGSGVTVTIITYLITH